MATLIQQLARNAFRCPTFKRQFSVTSFKKMDNINMLEEPDVQPQLFGSNNVVLRGDVLKIHPMKNRNGIFLILRVKHKKPSSDYVTSRNYHINIFNPIADSFVKELPEVGQNVTVYSNLYNPKDFNMITLLKGYYMKLH